MSEKFEPSGYLVTPPIEGLDVKVETFPAALPVGVQMSDLHSFRVRPYQESVISRYSPNLSAAKLMYLSNIYGRGMLRAAPFSRCFSAEAALNIFGGVDAWADHRFNVWVVRCYNPESRYWRQLFCRDVETLAQ